MRSWLEIELSAHRLLPAAPTHRVLGHEVYLRGWERGRLIGMAQGELKGRQDLADELAVAYAIDGGDKTLEREDVERIRVKQLH